LICVSLVHLFPFQVFVFHYLFLLTWCFFSFYLFLFLSFSARHLPYFCSAPFHFSICILKHSHVLRTG
jgi:hypothetical protein